METDDKIVENMTGEKDNNSQVSVESVRGNNEDMDDDSESQLEETKQFVSLLSKAERMNQKKLENQQRQQQPLQPSSWRDLGNPDDDTDETDDEDDPEETNKFLSMIKSKKKKNLVNIRWVNGKVEVTPVSEDADVADPRDPDDARALPDSVTVTRLGAGECLPGGRARPAIPDTVTITRVPAPGPGMVSGQDISHPGPRLPCFNITRAPAPQPLECVRKQREAETRESRDNKKGKRKFEDRMTLTEAKMTDFEDSRDYVDFLQSKLQGVNIKIVK